MKNFIRYFLILLLLISATIYVLWPDREYFLAGKAGQRYRQIFTQLVFYGLFGSQRQWLIQKVFSVAQYNVDSCRNQQ